MRNYSQRAKRLVEIKSTLEFLQFSGELSSSSWSVRQLYSAVVAAAPLYSLLALPVVYLYASAAFLRTKTKQLSNTRITENKH
jgi:hypothetical protein